MSRIEQRIQALMAAHAKLVDKVRDNPDDPRVSAWKSRVVEYEASLANIKATGKETMRGSPGVEIDVPESGFAVTANVPGE